MEYQLQPDLHRIQNPALPENTAIEQIFTYPESSRKNYGDYTSRPNTMLYGTSPYMAGKGAPADLINLSDELRPQSTSRFGFTAVDTYQRNLFPVDKVLPQPQLPNKPDPRSSRADIQNNLFDMRYNKNINK